MAKVKSSPLDGSDAKMGIAGDAHDLLCVCLAFIYIT